MSVPLHVPMLREDLRAHFEPRASVKTRSASRRAVGFVLASLVAVLVAAMLFGPTLSESPGMTALRESANYHESMRLFIEQSQYEFVPESLDVLHMDVRKDPWGGEYQIVILGRSTFVVRSNGPDCISETGDDIRFPFDGVEKSHRGR